LLAKATGRRGGNWPGRKAYGVHMMQAPCRHRFRVGPEPRIQRGRADHRAVVIILAVAVALRGILRSPVGEAFAERIRTRVQRRGSVGGDDPQALQS